MQIRIAVDKREKPSNIPKILSQSGINVDLATLRVGDYIISSNIVIERKTVTDFLKSIYDGRLFIQCSQLIKYFSYPIIILEGDVNNLENFNGIKGKGGFDSTQLYKSIASIILDYRISIIHTISIKHTINFLIALAYKSQNKLENGPLLRKIRKNSSGYNQQLSVLSSLPGIGVKLAVRMLDEFVTPKKALNASVSELAKISGLGVARAQKMRKIMDKQYIEKNEENQETLLQYIK